LIDGFPRNLENLDVWNKSMPPEVACVQGMLFLDCPEEEMEARMLARGRSDDTAATIKKRCVCVCVCLCVCVLNYLTIYSLLTISKHFLFLLLHTPPKKNTHTHTHTHTHTQHTQLQSLSRRHPPHRRLLRKRRQGQESQSGPTY
jgi:hypothetical protein